jgi:hypothetical protein
MKYRAPFWQRFFYQYSFLFFAFWFFLVAFLIGVLYPRPATTEAKERAKQLLNNGITNTNIPEAVELILIMETEYDPRSSTSRLEFPVWYKTLFYIGLAGCIAISCKPKTILGIGQGSEKISRWRLWYRFLGVVLPGLIFASFVWPYLEQVIRNFFN